MKNLYAVDLEMSGEGKRDCIRYYYLEKSEEEAGVRGQVNAAMDYSWARQIHIEKVTQL